jgi:hypothetical protein
MVGAKQAINIFLVIELNNGFIANCLLTFIVRLLTYDMRLIFLCSTSNGHFHTCSVGFEFFLS